MMTVVMMKITVLKVTSAAFVFQSGEAANPEPCTSRALGAAVEILSFRPELLLISLFRFGSVFFFSFLFSPTVGSALEAADPPACFFLLTSSGSN